MHPRDPNILFAATGHNLSTSDILPWGGIYRTRNGGQNWEEVLGNDIFTLVLTSSSNPDIVYAGSAIAIYRSDDGGDTWQKFQQGEGINQWGPMGIRAGVPIGAAIDPDDPMTIFVNNYTGGNFKSVDGGKNWVNASQGYSGAQLRRISIDADNPEIAYTSGRSGIFRTYSGGAIWDGIGYYPATPIEFYSILSFPGNSRKLIASGVEPTELYISEDAGMSWRIAYPAVTSLPGHGGFAMAVPASNPEVIYVGYRREGGMIRLSPGMLKSEDGGVSWREINQGMDGFRSINVIAVVDSTPNWLYIGTESEGAYHSTDGGESWQPINVGLPSLEILSLAIDPYDSLSVYAGLGEGQGIYKTSNCGASWSELNSNLQLRCPSWLRPVGAAQGIDLTHYTRRQRMPTREYQRLPWSLITDIEIDPTNNQRIWISDFHYGVYLSEDGGASWQSWNEGLGTPSVKDMEISSDGKTLYAATWGRGVFHLTQTNTEPQIISVIPSTDSVLQFNIGDTVLFSVFAIDLDGDSLTYSWELNGIFIDDAFYSQRRLNTEPLAPGSYRLNIIISDSIHTIEHLWQFNILDPSDIDESQSDNHPRFADSPAYPNPTNRDAIIPYTLPSAALVKLTIFNLFGKKIREIAERHTSSGRYSLRWDGCDQNGLESPSGVYFYRLEARTTKTQYQSITRKLIRLK